MTLWHMDGLLTAMRNAFGEPAIWQPTGPDGTIAFTLSITGRFRIDPYDVPLGGLPEGLNVTQTWFYCDQADVASPVKPGLGDYLQIRADWWEIVQVDADDLGELAYRLLKAPGRDAAAPVPHALTR